MRPTNTIQSMRVYAANSSYKQEPTPAQTAAGVVPLDTLPADWWNRILYDLTTNFNNTAVSVQSLYDEILTLLQREGITPNPTATDQLYNAIDKLRRTIASSTVPGSVISSTLSGRVQIDVDGVMTVVGLGTPTLLNTSARNVVGAINEILDILTNYIASNDSAVNGKAPISHASASTQYGVGAGATYRHLKLSSATDSTLGVNEGTAATPAAVKEVMDAVRALQLDTFNQMHPIGECYIQLPLSKTPNELWGEWSVWQEQGIFDGAFFRAANCPTQLYSLDSVTFYTDVELLNPVNVSGMGAITDTGNTEYNSKGVQVKIFSRTNTGAAAAFAPEGGTLTLQDDATAVNGLGDSNHYLNTVSTRNTGDTQDKTLTARITGGRSTGAIPAPSGCASGTNVADQYDSGGSDAWNIWLDVTHMHKVRVTSQDLETRPINYTIRLWKRIS